MKKSGKIKKNYSFMENFKYINAQVNEISFFKKKRKRRKEERKYSKIGVNF